MGGSNGEGTNLQISVGSRQRCRGVSDSPERLTSGNMSAVHALSMDVPAKPIIIPGDAGIVAKTT